jgi:hydroxymethylpyrimidine pyrophosphatase-like HAD family hydrolase
LRYRMLAFDYDETLATAGVLQPATAKALAAAKTAGWKLALVTGRPHEELLGICPQADLFDLIVDENGGVLRLGAGGAAEELAARPDPRLRQELARRGVEFFHGPIVTITRRRQEAETLAVVRDTGLPLDTYCNRFAIMIVPRGTNKARGLRTGLARLGLDASEVIAVGDDQNDVDFLRACGLRVAVANAIDALKAEADLVTDRPNGEGIARFIHERVLGATESLPAPRRPQPSGIS